MKRKSFDWMTCTILLAFGGNAVAQCDRGKLSQSDGRTGFGRCVAAGAGWAVVGAGGGGGAAYVFRFNGTRWVEDSVLQPSDGPGHSFGEAVAIDGDVIVVTDPADDDRGVASGSAYVFRFNSRRWQEEAKLLPRQGSGARFGESVGLSGPVIIVGASSGNEDTAYLFRYDGEHWSEERRFVEPFDSVSASGDRVLVAGGVRTGRVYRYNGAGWDLEAELRPGGGGGSFGHACQLRENVAIIGSYSESDGHGGNDAGAAYVFRFRDGSWAEEQRLAASDADGGDYFGWSVTIDGDYALAGALNDENGGSAYLFKFDGNAWAEFRKLQPAGPLLPWGFGTAVSAHDGLLLVGAPNDSEGGSTYVFHTQMSGCCNQVRAVLGECYAACGDGELHIEATVKTGLPKGMKFTVCLDGEDCRTLTTNRSGNCKVRWERVGAGLHEVCVQECGACVTVECCE